MDHLLRNLSLVSESLHSKTKGGVGPVLASKHIPSTPCLFCYFAFWDENISQEWTQSINNEHFNGFSVGMSETQHRNGVVGDYCCPISREMSVDL